MLTIGVQELFRSLSIGGWIIGGFALLVGGFGIANIMFAFASIVANAFDPFVIVSMNAMILGMAFYVLSVIQQLKSFKILADIWWAGSIFFFFMPGIHSLLFMAIMLAASAWIPWAEEKKQNKVI